MGWAVRTKDTMDVYFCVLRQPMVALLANTTKSKFRFIVDFSVLSPTRFNRSRLIVLSISIMLCSFVL